jgi:hypothetical protein
MRQHIGRHIEKDVKDHLATRQRGKQQKEQEHEGIDQVKPEEWCVS